MPLSSNVRKHKDSMKNAKHCAALGLLCLAVACGDSGETPSADQVRVRLIGNLDSDISAKILERVQASPFSMQSDSPILMQGAALSRLEQSQTGQLEATYRAGHTIVLLDATTDHIAALHEVVGEGVAAGLKSGEVVLAYALRREQRIPKATVLLHVQPSPLRTSAGEPETTGLEDDERALGRNVDRVVNELAQRPNAGSEAPGDPNQQATWQDNPLQTTTLAIQSAGVYNTSVSVFALHACNENTDHYVVTAGSDWTATDAKFQSASTERGNSSMYYDADNDVYVVASWADDPDLTYCSSGGFFADNADICRYVNYPLQYELVMLPPATGTVLQLNAAPAATQGRSATLQNGFSFGIAGSVNVSGNGPQAGLSAGATWSNMQSTTVPPLELEVGNQGNEGAFWTFRYCTDGEEPDEHSDCTSHVQTTRDVCRARFGDFSGTNPQQGQTPDGKLSNSVQSVHWQQPTSGRTASSFDIEVQFTPVIATTTANLWVPTGREGADAGCNAAGCDCVSSTTSARLTKSVTFKVPYPSTVCQ